MKLIHIRPPSCLVTSPFVPFKSSIMNRLLRVRPSQKLKMKACSFMGWHIRAGSDKTGFSLEGNPKEKTA